MNMYSEAEGTEFSIGQVSDENIEDVFDTFKRMNQAKGAGMLQSAKYVEAGGIAAAIKESATAGEIGIEADLMRLAREDGIELHETMYGETEGRFLVTVKAEEKESFEELFRGKFSWIGIVKGDSLKVLNGAEIVLDEKIDGLIRIYHSKTEETRAA